MTHQLKKEDWKRISEAIHSCIFCLSKEHSSKDCPLKSEPGKPVTLKSIRDRSVRKEIL